MSWRYQGEPPNSCPIFDSALELLGRQTAPSWGTPKREIPIGLAESIANHIASEWKDFAHDMEIKIEEAREINAGLRKWAHAELEKADDTIADRDETIRKLESRVEELEREADALSRQLAYQTP